jgi:diaminopimelate epimerase
VSTRNRSTRPATKRAVTGAPRVSRKSARPSDGSKGLGICGKKRSSAARFLSFLKVEGAGNDFVLIDARRAPAAKTRWSREAIRALLDRRHGVGGDGLLVLRPARRDAIVEVRFWNPDGRPAAFCGNGARCVAAFLLKNRPATAEAEFRLGRVRVLGRRAGGRMAVLIPVPRSLEPPEGPPPVPLADQGAWYESGVPHWIVPVSRIEAVDLDALARPLRDWPALGAGGTNVDLVEVREGDVLVRTFERGVEGETLACGSGLAAAGWWAAQARGLPYPIRLRTRGGDRLRLEPDGAGRGLWLTGPVRIVFSGRVAVG